MPCYEMVEEKPKQDLLLGLLKSHDLCDELSVDEKALLARDRMDSDQWVDGINWIFTNQATDGFDVIDHLG